jgi:antirestriction protein ArdC
VDSTQGEWSTFGNASYSKEELVAEMGAAFLCGHAGISERILDNSASYIAGWLHRLKDDKRLVIQVAALAQKAADYILGRHRPDEPEVES